MSDYIFKLISGGLPFCLTVIVGGYFTFKTRFFQLRNFRNSFKILKGGSDNGISGFAAMCNSLSAAVGTGNIVGVAAAISLGGAGSVFWMLLASFLGMTVKAAEIALGVYFRQKKGENYMGGPHIYIKKSLPDQFKFVGYIFAFVGVLATVFCGNMAQINSAVSAVSNRIEIRGIFGAAVAATVFLVICGGAEKIARFLSKILPFMALFYIALCLFVILRNYTAVPSAVSKIFVGAFSPRAVTGGAVGSVFTALSIGASKGIFSNEAGVGTAPIIHSQVKEAEPLRQSFYGIFEVFADTTVLCSLTALTILTSGVIIEYGDTSSFNTALLAFSTLFGKGSAVILSGMLTVFGVSSVIGWASYGISFSEFLFGTFGKSIFVKIYPVFCVLGAILSTDFIWQTAEFLNGVMVIINLLALTYLSKTVLTLLKEKK